MSIIIETKKRLLEIKLEFLNFKNFTISTMETIDERSKEIKALAVNILGKDEEIFKELNNIQIISVEYKNKGRGLEIETLRQALKHLDFGIELFLIRLK